MILAIGIFLLKLFVWIILLEIAFVVGVFIISALGGGKK